MKEVWPDAFVEEANLSRNIFMLRKVLGESSKDHQYILTVPGRGYRFAESVRLVPEQEVGIIAAQHSKVQIQVKESKRWVWIAAGIVVVAIGAALVSLLKRPPAVPVVEAVTQLTDDGEPKPFSTKIVTDGVRAYFNEGAVGSFKIAQVGVTGGCRPFRKPGAPRDLLSRAHWLHVESGSSELSKRTVSAIEVVPQ